MRPRSSKIQRRGTAGARLVGRLAVTVVMLAGAGAAVAWARSAAVPQNVSAPTVEGKLMVGAAVSADAGTWVNGPTRFAYRWSRCDSQGSGCTDIVGAAEKSYTAVASDEGRRLVVVVTASNADGSASANSKPSGVVSPRAAPRGLTDPVVTGKVEVGEQLTVEPGKYTAGIPASFVYRWLRCDAKGASCAEIAGAAEQTYTVRKADLESTLRARVTASNDLGSDTSTSDRTDVVTGSIGGGANPCVRVPAGAGSVPVSDVALPQRLLIANVQFSPAVVRSRTEPIIARFRVFDTCDRAVRGALVYAIGVPFGRLEGAPEVPTEADGWAEIRLSPTSRFTPTSGGSLVIFVRARKPNDDLLAGISSRRLVQIRAGG